MEIWNKPLNSNKMISMLLGAALMLPATFAYGEEAGRVKLDGREIILNDDNTWKYADTDTKPVSTDTNCVRLKSKVLPASVCLDEKVWQLDDSSGAAELSFVTKGGKLFLMMITEKDEITLDKFEKAIVINAQKVAGLKPVDVKIKDRIEALGSFWGRMVYDVPIDDKTFTFENVFTNIDGKGAVQFVFYSENVDYNPSIPEIEKAKKQISIK